MAINSNRNFKSRETGRRYRVENRCRADLDQNNIGHKYIAYLWDDAIERYSVAVNGLGDVITGKTIADVQRFVNMEDFWITTYEKWIKEAL